MPINCPIPFGANRDCEGCRSFTDEMCYFNSLNPRPVSEILTTNERLELLERTQEHIIPPKRYYQELKAQLNSIYTKLDKACSKRKDKL